MWLYVVEGGGVSHKYRKNYVEICRKEGCVEYKNCMDNYASKKLG